MRPSRCTCDLGGLGHRPLPARSSAARSAGSTGGARSGGGTTRPSAASRPSGTPGKCCGCSPAPASAPGTATTSTTSCRSCWAPAGPSTSAAKPSHREPREAAARPLPSERQDPRCAGEYGAMPGLRSAALGQDAESLPMTPAEPDPAGLDPAHILAICTEFGQRRRRPGARTADGVRVSHAVQACGLDRPAAPLAGSATRPPIAGDDRRTPGRARHRLERRPAGLTADRVAHGHAPARRQPVSHRDGSRPPVRRAAGRRRHSRATENILDESRVQLRGWVDARAGICAPSPPAVAPADTATAMRVRAALPASR